MHLLSNPIVIEMLFHGHAESTQESFELGHLLDLHSQITCKVLGMTLIMEQRSSVGTGAIKGL